MLAGLRSRVASKWEDQSTKKVRRITYHVVRGAKKFVFGTGQAAWVVGTSMLVMVLPLVFEMDRDLNEGGFDAAAGMAPPPQ